MGSDSNEVLWDLVSAATSMHVLRAFVVLGVPDAVPAEGIPLVEFAAATHAPPDRLRRFLHASSGLGLCNVASSDICTLTPAGRVLRSDAGNDVRTWAMLMTAPWIQRAWDRLPDAVRGNADDTFEAANGASFWENLASNPDAELLFDTAMAGSGAARGRALLGVLRQLRPRTVADVGGGDGSLLLTILDGCPATRGVLAERVAVLRGAVQAHADTRIDVVEADFFERVPAGGDAYVLSRVLHDHDDEPAVAILRSCRAAMSTGSRLLIVESIVPEWDDLAGGDRLSLAMKDLNMHVLVGGRERTIDEYRSLLGAAELLVEDIDSTTAGIDVIVAAPA